MSVTLTIHITKEVLEQSKMCGLEGDRLISQNCAVALAVRHVWPEASVGPRVITLRFINIDLPLSAEEFILAFDGANPHERVKMTPMSFDIEVPDEVINSINIDELLKLGNTVTKKEVAA